MQSWQPLENNYKVYIIFFRLYLVCLYWIYSGFVLYNSEDTRDLRDTEINQMNPKCLSKSKLVFSVCITTNGHLKELMEMLKTKWNGKVYYKKLLKTKLEIQNYCKHICG